MLRGAVGGLADTGEFVEEFALPSEDLRDPLVDASLGEEPMDLNGLHLSHSGRPRDCLPLGRRLSCGSQITTTDAAWMLRPTPPRMKQPYAPTNHRSQRGPVRSADMLFGVLSWCAPPRLAFGSPYCRVWLSCADAASRNAAPLIAVTLTSTRMSAAAVRPERTWSGRRTARFARRSRG